MGVDRMRANALFLLIGTLLMSTPARAEVVSADSGGFQIRSVLTIAAPAEKVYAALGEIDKWWSPAHTWSGNSANLHLSLQAGGCLCEKLDNGGSVQHMVVVYAAPGKELRLSGGLGPLQREAAVGTLTFSLTAKGAATEVVEVYNVGGYTKGGWTSWAPNVDEVLSQQLGRLKSYVEIGKPQ